MNRVIKVSIIVNSLVCVVGFGRSNDIIIGRFLNMKEVMVSIEIVICLRVYIFFYRLYIIVYTNIYIYFGIIK